MATKGPWRDKATFLRRVAHTGTPRIVHTPSRIPFQKLLENIPSKAFADFVDVWLERMDGGRGEDMI